MRIILPVLIFEDRQQIRDEVLIAKIEDMRNYAELVEAVMNKKSLCCFRFGNQSERAADLLML